jgi:DNA repair exonuclease SbcCD ATPase subunit
MIIKSISIKNFKSFGNNTQTVFFSTSTGELILLSGENGAGKSSLQQSIDFSLFGIVRGKSGKKVKQSILPNRINKNLETNINFINNSSNDICIQRGLEPTLNKLIINNSDDKKVAKSYTKEDLIGFDYDTYKNFISMSVSDFANFIDLNQEDKRNIINRIFNLKDLDNYLSLCNAKIKQYNDEIVKYSTIIQTNTQTIESLNRNIVSIQNVDLYDKERELSKLEEEKESKRDPYISLKKKIESYQPIMIELDAKLLELNEQKNINNNKIIEIRIEIKSLNDKIRIYKSGSCPTCNSDLKDHNHLNILTEIISKSEELTNQYTKLESKNTKLTLKINKISTERNNILKEKSTTTTDYNNIIYDLKNISKKISFLKEKSKLNDNISVTELTKNITDLEIKNFENINKIDKLNNEIKIYDELKLVFSNNGIRKNIIRNITKPLNVYITDILVDLKSPYNIKIDDDFNVNIYERLSLSVDPESLSVGESKKINIAIALSYLKLILKYRKLNIIFLDEVFSSMEPEHVELALKVLKDLTKEFNLNIIILDPNVYFRDSSSFGYSYFDRIIKITKKLNFSTINEETCTKNKL